MPLEYERTLKVVKSKIDLAARAARMSHSPDAVENLSCRPLDVFEAFAAEPGVAAAGADVVLRGPSCFNRECTANDECDGSASSHVDGLYSGVRLRLHIGESHRRKCGHIE